MRKLHSVLLGCLLAIAGTAAFGQVTQAAKSVSILTFGGDPTGVADVQPKIAAAIAAGATRILFPPGQYLLAGAGTVNLTNIEIECQGAPAQYNPPPAYGTSGATFQMTSTSVQPFALAGGVRIKGCNFYWPNQTCAASVVVYPPLFTEQVGKQLNSLSLEDDRIVNAYGVLDQANTTDPFGAIQFSNTMGYAIDHWFKLSFVSEWVTISGFFADFGLFQNSAAFGASQVCANYTAASGSFMHVFGNGNGSTVGSSVTVGGFNFAAGGIYAYNKFIWVDSTGNVSEAKVHTIFDAIPHVLQVDSGGCAADLELDGAVYSYQAVFPGPGPGGADNATAFSIGTPPTSICSNSDIRITGHLFSSQGDVLDVLGNGTKGVYINLSGSGAYAQTSTPGTYYFAQVNGAQAIVDFVGNHIEPKNSGSSYRGLNLIQCYTCTVTGNSFNGVYDPITLGAGMTSTYQAVAVGNISLNAPSGSVPIVGTGDTAHVLLMGNIWDRQAPPVFGACGTGPALANSRSNDLSGTIITGTGGPTSCAITFANAWSTVPNCQVSGPALADLPTQIAATTTTLTVTSASGMTSQPLLYSCKPAGL